MDGWMDAVNGGRVDGDGWDRQKGVRGGYIIRRARCSSFFISPGIKSCIEGGFCVCPACALCSLLCLLASLLSLSLRALSHSPSLVSVSSCESFGTYQRVGR